MKKNKVTTKIIEHYYFNFVIGMQYLNLSNQLQKMGMINFAKFLHNLANDKLITHKDILLQYITRNRLEISGKFDEFDLIVKKDPKEVMKYIYDAEEQIRKIVNEISKLSIDENDFESFHFLTWFVNDGLKDFEDIQKIYELFKLSNDNLSIDQSIKELNEKESCK